VIERVYSDLAEVAEKANRFGLRFDYEQHEDLRADEIATILTRIGDERINALFDRADARLVDVPLRFRGFVAPNELLAGYGLSLRPQVADLAAIHVLEPVHHPNGKSAETVD